MLKMFERHRFAEGAREDLLIPPECLEALLNPRGWLGNYVSYTASNLTC